MKILAVDDDLMARSMLLEALRLAGHDDVTLASSGADALRKLQLSETPFDCFLLDIQMDDMDGIALCEHIRQLPGYADIPIIMVTGLQEKRYMDLAFSAGATDYVTKPFDMMELGTRVRIAEQMSQKIRRIARNESELSKLRNIVETLETRQQNPSVEIATEGFMKPDRFENTLQQLSRSDLVHGALVKCQIVDFERLSARCKGEDLQTLLADVAVAIGNVFERKSFLGTYGGNGMFVILFLQAPPSDQDLLQVQENLNQIRLSADTGFSDFVMLDFSERVSCSQLSIGDSFHSLQDEQPEVALEKTGLGVRTGEGETAQPEETPQQKLQRRLKQMVPHYMSVLNEAMILLEELHQKLQTGQCSWEEVEEIERTAHRIAGAAPSLGFAELGAAAADTEELAARGPGTKSLSESCRAIRPALARLLDRIEDTIVDNLV